MQQPGRSGDSYISEKKKNVAKQELPSAQDQHDGEIKQTNKYIQLACWEDLNLMCVSICCNSKSMGQTLVLKVQGFARNTAVGAT